MRSEGWQYQLEARGRGKKLCRAPEGSSGIDASFPMCWVDQNPPLFCTRRGGMSGL